MIRGTSSRGAMTAASSPTTSAAIAAAACGGTVPSTSASRSTLATMPTPAAASAIRHGLLNMSAKPSTPRKLATNRSGQQEAGVQVGRASAGRG